jgi:monofunctional biosynthetic peptidoglycan transglycosylase
MREDRPTTRTTPASDDPSAPEVTAPAATSPPTSKDNGGTARPLSAPVLAGPLDAPPAAARWRVLAWRLATGLLVAAGIYGLAVMLAILAYRWVDPPTSAVMLGQRLTGSQIVQSWVPLERVSLHLVRAVIASEDAGFCRHRGVDWRELEAAIEQTREGAPRGGSTIPMQVSKNLFLWSSRSYVRKALEIPITLASDLVWSKSRTLEIYLNIAEWGPGVFGAEAAARYHFGKSALLLTEREAALLAVALPNPVQRISGAPSPLQIRLAQRLLVRMRTVGDRTGCVLGGKGP